MSVPRTQWAPLPLWGRVGWGSFRRSMLDPHPGVLRTPTLPTISALIAASTILVLALMLAR